MKYLILVMALFAFPAIAAAQNIDVVPTSCDFDDVVVGDTASTTFTITGISSVDAIIDLIEIIDDPVGVFALEEPLNPELPVILDLGEVAYYDVTFAPSDIGGFSATLRIRSTDLAHGGAWDVPLSGTGVVPEPSMFCLLAVAALGLLACNRRVHRRS